MWWTGWWLWCQCWWQWCLWRWLYYLQEVDMASSVSSVKDILRLLRRNSSSCTPRAVVLCRWKESNSIAVGWRRRHSPEKLPKPPKRSENLFQQKTKLLHKQTKRLQSFRQHLLQKGLRKKNTFILNMNYSKTHKFHKILKISFYLTQRTNDAILIW